MSIRRKIRWQIAVYFGTASCLLLLVLPREPRHEGRSLSSWLKDFDRCRVAIGVDPCQDAPDACRAIRAMGSNAVPALLRLLGSKDSRFKRSLISISDEVPFLRMSIKDAAVFRNRAALAFVALGPDLGSATQGIRELLLSAETADTAMVALSGSGSVRAEEIGYALTNAPEKVRATAAYVLAAFPSNKEAALPYLIKGLDDDSWVVRRNSAFGLARLGAEPALVVPALTKALDETNSPVLLQAIRALGQLGPQAASAVPALVEIGSRGTGPRDEIVKALRKIDPSALALLDEPAEGAASDPSVTRQEPESQ